ncbi:MAG: NAD(+) kinase, partial [Sphingobacteriales bacterium]
MRIAVIGKPFKPEVLPFIQQLFDELHQRGAEISIVEHFKTFLDNNLHLPAGIFTFSRGDSLSGIDFVFSIGGDGTLLDTVTYVGKKEIPIVGINTGRLGFLATVAKESITSTLEALYRGHYSIDKRTLIRVDSETEIFDGINFGLNEFSLLKRDSSSMIVVHTYIDGEYLNSYWADGLVVA